MERFLILLVLVSPIFWILSIFMLSDWKHFWKFFIANTLLFIAYLALTSNPELIDFEQDEYGLKRFSTLVLATFTHIILGLIFAIGYRWKRRTKGSE